MNFKDWREYPLGTRAYAFNGGHWEKAKMGWKWCTGAIFPTPGGDAFRIELPNEKPKEDHGKDS